MSLTSLPHRDLAPVLERLGLLTRWVVFVGGVGAAVLLFLAGLVLGL